MRRQLFLTVLCVAYALSHDVYEDHNANGKKINRDVLEDQNINGDQNYANGDRNKRFVSLSTLSSFMPQAISSANFGITSGFTLLRKMYNSSFAKEHFIFKRRVLNLILRYSQFFLSLFPEQPVEVNPQLYQIGAPLPTRVSKLVQFVTERPINPIYINLPTTPEIEITTKRRRSPEDNLRYGLENMSPRARLAYKRILLALMQRSNAPSEETTAPKNVQQEAEYGDDLQSSFSDKFELTVPPSYVLNKIKESQTEEIKAEKISITSSDETNSSSTAAPKISSSDAVDEDLHNKNESVNVSQDFFNGETDDRHKIAAEVESSKEEIPEKENAKEEIAEEENSEKEISEEENHKEEITKEENFKEEISEEENPKEKIGEEENIEEEIAEEKTRKEIAGEENPKEEIDGEENHKEGIAGETNLKQKTVEQTFVGVVRNAEESAERFRNGKNIQIIKESRIPKVTNDEDKSLLPAQQTYRLVDSDSLEDKNGAESAQNILDISSTERIDEDRTFSNIVEEDLTTPNVSEEDNLSSHFTENDVTSSHFIEEAVTSSDGIEQELTSTHYIGEEVTLLYNVEEDVTSPASVGENTISSHVIGDDLKSSNEAEGYVTSSVFEENVSTLHAVEEDILSSLKIGGDKAEKNVTFPEIIGNNVASPQVIGNNVASPEFIGKDVTSPEIITETTLPYEIASSTDAFENNETFSDVIQESITSSHIIEEDLTSVTEKIIASSKGTTNPLKNTNETQKLVDTEPLNLLIVYPEGFSDTGAKIAPTLAEDNIASSAELEESSVSPQTERSEGDYLMAEPTVNVSKDVEQNEDADVLKTSSQNNVEYVIKAPDDKGASSLDQEVWKFKPRVNFVLVNAGKVENEESVDASETTNRSNEENDYNLQAKNDSDSNEATLQEETNLEHIKEAPMDPIEEMVYITPKKEENAKSDSTFHESTTLEAMKLPQIKHNPVILFKVEEENNEDVLIKYSSSEKYVSRENDSFTQECSTEKHLQMENSNLENHETSSVYFEENKNVDIDEILENITEFSTKVDVVENTFKEENENFKVDEAQKDVMERGQKAMDTLEKEGMDDLLNKTIEDKQEIEIVDFKEADVADFKTGETNNNVKNVLHSFEVNKIANEENENLNSENTKEFDEAETEKVTENTYLAETTIADLKEEEESEEENETSQDFNVEMNKMNKNVENIATNDENTKPQSEESNKVGKENDEDDEEDKENKEEEAEEEESTEDNEEITKDESIVKNKTKSGRIFKEFFLDNGDSFEEFGLNQGTLEKDFNNVEVVQSQRPEKNEENIVLKVSKVEETKESIPSNDNEEIYEAQESQTSIHQTQSSQIQDNKVPKYIYVVIRKKPLLPQIEETLRSNIEDNSSFDRRKRHVGTSRFSKTIENFRRIYPEFQGFSNHFQYPPPPQKVAELIYNARQPEIHVGKNAYEPENVIKGLNYKVEKPKNKNSESTEETSYLFKSLPHFATKHLFAKNLGGSLGGERYVLSKNGLKILLFNEASIKPKKEENQIVFSDEYNGFDVLPYFEAQKDFKIVEKPAQQSHVPTTQSDITFEISEEENEGHFKDLPHFDIREDFKSEFPEYNEFKLLPHYEISKSFHNNLFGIPVKHAGNEQIKNTHRGDVFEDSYEDEEDSKEVIFQKYPVSGTYGFNNFANSQRKPKYEVSSEYPGNFEHNSDYQKAIASISQHDLDEFLDYNSANPTLLELVSSDFGNFGQKTQNKVKGSKIHFELEKDALFYDKKPKTVLNSYGEPIEVD